MNKPDGITQEAWDAAQKASASRSEYVPNYSRTAFLTEIAKAIQSAVEAERSRCAAIADDYRANPNIWESDERTTAKISANYAGTDIAQAIRSGK